MISIAQLKGESTRPETDDQMDQIRELLVGELMRRSDARMESLEKRLKDFEEEMGGRLEALAARIEALGAETSADRRSAFEELSRGIADLGDRIRNLSST